MVNQLKKKKRESNYLNLKNQKGAQVNRMEVSTLVNGQKQRIFNIASNQGRPWRIARVDLSISDEFEIYFDAFRGAGPNG